MTPILRCSTSAFTRDSPCERSAARAGRTRSIDPEVSIDEALREFGEDLLNEPLSQKLLQALGDRGQEADHQDQGSWPRYLHTPFRAPPTELGLRLGPVHAGPGATEFFSLCVPSLTDPFILHCAPVSTGAFLRLARRRSGQDPASWRPVGALPVRRRHQPQFVAPDKAFQISAR
jgi:hypothetical protein